MNTLHIGLGTIGQEIVKAALKRSVGEPIGGVDPLWAGKTLADLPALAELNVPAAPIFSSLAEALESLPLDVAVVSTVSIVEGIARDLFALIAAGVNVVSTCENLSYPWLKTPELARQLDKAAREAGVTIVGTGVNPGFVLDALPVLLTRPCETVRQVRAVRIVDTAQRRRQLQLKTGAGLTEAEFRARAQAGQLGHVGLSESAALIARGLGWEITPAHINETIEPILRPTTVQTDYVTAGPELCKGQFQRVTVQAEGGGSIILELTMELGAPEQYDEIFIEGEPNIHVRIEGGLFGDTATAGCTVNILRQVVQAPPGLLTVLDLPIA